ncbi:MAG: aminotransferase class V-fold PLP-dependent enzyme, partial [Phycisphaerales bacterium]|nr:aminotransferase class V-fold PLP-dependent enzyme [Phycisphaerales bacterium]
MNNRLIYLDNAATSWPKPEAVGEAMCMFLRDAGGNPGRGGHELARAASGTLESARIVLAGLVNAPSSKRVVLTHGCTDALNIAIHGVMWSGMVSECDRTPRVVCSCLEHNAVLRTLHCYSTTGLIDLEVIGCGIDGRTDPDVFLAACDERTILACVTHASNVLGTIQEVGRIGKGLRERSPRALYLVDVAQTLGHLPIDVQTGHVDLVAVAGHKGLRGPTGTGALYVGERAFPDDPAKPRLYCQRRGGTGMTAPGLEMPKELPDALEAGTMNAVGFAGLLAAIDEPCEGGHAIERELTERMLTGLGSIAGVKIFGVPGIEGRTGVVLFDIEGVHPREAADRLDREHRIAVRGGVHCAPLAHNAIGTGERGGIRASVGPCNTCD